MARHCSRCFREVRAKHKRLCYECRQKNEKKSSSSSFNLSSYRISSTCVCGKTIKAFGEVFCYECRRRMGLT
jgi:hypothetical protein